MNIQNWFFHIWNKTAVWFQRLTSKLIYMFQKYQWRSWQGMGGRKRRSTKYNPFGSNSAGNHQHQGFSVTFKNVGQPVYFTRAFFFFFFFKYLWSHRALQVLLWRKVDAVFNNREAVAWELLKNQTCKVLMLRAGLDVPHHMMQPCFLLSFHKHRYYLYLHQSVCN